MRHVSWSRSLLGRIPASRPLAAPASSLRSDVAPRTASHGKTLSTLLPVRIAIGGDHAGYPLKQHLVQMLKEWGHDVDDLGTHSEDPVDYPFYCAAVARAVVRGGAERGIVLGGSGQGEQISANKVHGARAALCNELYTARMARAHNDANVLSIGARVVAAPLADEIVRIFLDTPFEGGRHVRRLEEITQIEQEEAGA
jgi:ribose 5-phosphate isomerase B